MATSGSSADTVPPGGKARQSLRRPLHSLENGRVNRSERDIVGLGSKCCLQFRLVMGAESELQAGGADCAKVGLRQVLLAEMDEVAAFRDRQLPVVVDDELAALPRSQTALAARISRRISASVRSLTRAAPA